MSPWIAVLAAVPSLSALAAWLAWLRFVRYVHDKSGVEGLKAVPQIAQAFRERRWSIRFKTGLKSMRQLPAANDTAAGRGHSDRPSD
jgi:hypothetical protein